MPKRYAGTVTSKLVLRAACCLCASVLCVVCGGWWLSSSAAGVCGVWCVVCVCVWCNGATTQHTTLAVVAVMQPKHLQPGTWN